MGSILFSLEGLIEACCAVLCLVTQSCPTLCNSMDFSLPGPRPWAFSRQQYLSGLLGPPSGNLPNPGIEPRSPILQADSLPSEPPGKPKNTRVGNLSLFQGIFPTQGSNPGLPYYRQILYHLSHQGSPRILEWVTYHFSRGSSQPRDRTQVSHITGRFFTI